MKSPRLPLEVRSESSEISASDIQSPTPPQTAAAMIADTDDDILPSFKLEAVCASYARVLGQRSRCSSAIPAVE
ncbi:hypothetical protein PsYK624_099490 [Phanerochaete sordida]|uniref:Uncharacterized protein n=1 Tax=Phanerochaete sordida TaxID=48140 RepID=A0A9P3GDP5_9APHY|nr:hypothetical protein PsYK624_099490 [Phanerochaete sordida]